jgi:hypothetical protein
MALKNIHWARFEVASRGLQKRFNLFGAEKAHSKTALAARSLGLPALLFPLRQFSATRLPPSGGAAALSGMAGLSTPCESDRLRL